MKEVNGRSKMAIGPNWSWPP